VSEMVDRLKAILAVFDLDGASGFYESELDKATRAMIAGMRKPTEEMTRAGNKLTDWASGADDAWEVMVDELLK
jgi:hypothetical protein